MFVYTFVLVHMFVFLCVCVCVCARVCVSYNILSEYNNNVFLSKAFHCERSGRGRGKSGLITTEYDARIKKHCHNRFTFDTGRQDIQPCTAPVKKLC